MENNRSTEGKYKKLVINTLLFAIGQFGPSFLGFFLVPIYTNCMSRSEFGTADLVISLSSMFIPFISICISDGVVKFALDGKHDRKGVFSVSFLVCLIGSLLSFAAYPLVQRYGQIPEYMMLFYMILITSLFNNLLLLYIKALQKLSHYTVISLVKSLTMLVSNIIALRVLNLGINGFLWSYVLSNVVGCILAVIIGRLNRYISLKYVTSDLVKEMTSFSLPLIPNQMSISAMSSMDRYMLTYMLDSSYNGLYSIAHKLPYLVNMFSSVFNQSWNYSALENQSEKNPVKFYQSIYKIYGCYMFVAASMIMTLLKPVMLVWVGDEFKESWYYAPYLLIGVVFSAFTGFFVPLFVICEKTGTLFVSTLTGAVVNFILNLILIPVWGINGASFASAVSFITVWIIREFMIRKYVDIQFDNRKALLNALLLFIQGTCLMMISTYWFAVQVLFTAVIFLINLKEIKAFIAHFLNMIKVKKKVNEG